MARNEPRGELYKWLRDNGCNVVQRERETGIAVDRQSYSHMFMNSADGGKFAVPLKLHKRFLTVLAEDVKQGFRHYISELATPIHPHYWEIDWKFYISPCSDQEDPQQLLRNNEQGLNELLLEYVRTMIQVVRRFYPPTTDDSCFQVILLTRVKELNTRRNEHGKWTISMGLHGVFPYLLTDTHMDEQMRAAQIGNLQFQFGPKEDTQNSWDDFVDPSPYRNQNMRLPYVNKAEVCKACAGSKVRDILCVCNGSRRVDKGRAYLPWKVLNADGIEVPDLTRRLQTNARETLLLSTIRNHTMANKTPGFALYPGCPRLMLPDSVHIKKQPQTGHMRWKQDVQTLNRKRLTKCNWDRRTLDIVEAHIRQMFAERHARVCVDKISQTQNLQVYFVTLIPHCDGSQSCLNLRPPKQCHTTNGIYFEVTKSGICQRCFSKKTDTITRYNGPCHQFRSPRIPLTDELRQLFFPNLSGSDVDPMGLLRVQESSSCNLEDFDTWNKHHQCVLGLIDENRAAIRNHYHDLATRQSHQDDSDADSNSDADADSNSNEDHRGEKKQKTKNNKHSRTPPSKSGSKPRSKPRSKSKKPSTRNKSPAQGRQPSRTKKRKQDFDSD